MSDDHDDDFDEDNWGEEPDESGVIDCPNCGGEVYEDAPQCPHCGEYVVRGSRRIWAGKPGWYVLLAALGMLATALFLVLPR